MSGPRGRCRAFVASGFVTGRDLGFGSLSRTLGTAGVAGVLGLGAYLLQRPPSTDPVVVVNAFAQVLPVSIAEVVVCWVVVGGSVAALVRHRGLSEWVADGTALVVASVLFGVYHFAHSPPFNTVGMVGVLTLVSVGTGLFYFVGGSTDGALVFHNFLAVFGVTTALVEAGRSAALRISHRELRTRSTEGRQQRPTEPVCETSRGRSARPLRSFHGDTSCPRVGCLRTGAYVFRRRFV